MKRLSSSCARLSRFAISISLGLTGFLAMLVAAGLLSSAGTAAAALIAVAGTITVGADYGDSFKRLPSMALFWLLLVWVCQTPYWIN